ncbi:MAG TPA: transcription antitermination factor NusB, partial [Methylophilaceae bacterium]|nr:transcription antitermination factor NusB [Methylophilaceae bacterium]
MSNISVNPRVAKKRKSSKSRRKSRELVLKAIYRCMLNEGDVKQILLDMHDDPDYSKADEDYFKQLLGGVFENVSAIDAEIATFIDREINELSPIEHAI